MKKIIKLGILLFIIGTWACKGEIKQKNQENYKGSETNNAQKTTGKVKWDDDLINIKGPQGDTTGWYMSESGTWIDTMRDEKYKYNPWPPHDLGKTYYPNCTVHLPGIMGDSFDGYQDIKIYVKTLDQKYVGWIYPLRSTKLFKGKQIAIRKIIESGPRYQYSSIEILGEDTRDRKRSNAENQMAIDIQQKGDVIISQISHYKIEGYANMVYAKTEVTVYDLKGKELASIIRDGAIANAEVSENNKYLFQTYGGQITEDTKLPSGASIYNMHTKKYLWKKESLDDCIGVGPYIHTSLAKLSVIINCNKKHSQNTTLIMNTENGKIYKFSSLTKCNPSRIRVSSDGRIYFNTQYGKEFLSLDLDFVEFDIINLN